jgi:hypothetical protein
MNWREKWAPRGIVSRLNISPLQSFGMAPVFRGGGRRRREGACVRGRRPYKIKGVEVPLGGAAYKYGVSDRECRRPTRE